MSDWPLIKIADQIVYESLLFSDEASPFRSTLFSQGAEGDVLVIVGENASGKSLFFRMVAELARKQEITPITISIRERTGAGHQEMARMMRTFMFGDEGEQSTGATSANVVSTGFHNARREKPAFLMLDEPEIGLSDGYARALGEYIATEADVEHEHYKGLVIVTHSRSLVDGLVENLKNRPLFVHLGAEPRSLLQWLSEPEVRSVEDLKNLRTVAAERRKAVHQLLVQRDKGFGHDEGDPK